ncbi:hypothetical protein A0H81_06832 [Grifola frondosa]|uniref:TFIIS-type domain-containing protein n=1 Tax=Grifola frondosa TaxID=5627 RepID=A0A1C7MA91_GRIFR|nr:hypothetical protein A0H81_06832 [Grifola frondosa]
MASEEHKAADQKIAQENLFKTLGAEEVQAETDAFQCGRCKQRKCRYRHAQTRSADEPMTAFVTCTVCNNSNRGGSISPSKPTSSSSSFRRTLANSHIGSSAISAAQRVNWRRKFRQCTFVR